MQYYVLDFKSGFPLRVLIDPVTGELGLFTEDEQEGTEQEGTSEAISDTRKNK